MHFSINKGLHLPVDGQPDLSIHPGHEDVNMALLGNKYIDLIPATLEDPGVYRGKIYCMTLVVR